MQYRIDKVDARDDGSGYVRLDVWALDDAGNVIPERHKDVLVPSAELDKLTELHTKGERDTELAKLLAEVAGEGWDEKGLTEHIALLSAKAAETAKATASVDAAKSWLTPGIAVEVPHE